VTRSISPPRPRLRPRDAAMLLSAVAVLHACAPSRGTPVRRPLDASVVDGRVGDPTRLYHAMGLAAGAGAVPFVATAAYFAGRTADSTLTVVAVSLPSRALTFAREGQRYRAPYAVELRTLREGVEVSRTDAFEIVRVGAFRETARGDETVIFQRWFSLAPGNYTLRLAVRDVGSGRSSSDTLQLFVPRLAPMTGRISSALPVYEARARDRLDSIPSLLPRPRSTAIFGRDTVVAVYLEGYASGGEQTLPLAVSVRNDAAAVVWSDTLSLPRRGPLYSGTLRIPVARVGVGSATVSVTRPGSGDTARSPLFLSFGEDLPIAPFEEMLGYLRFFASANRLRALRDAAPDRRAELWADFLRETDPAPHTPEHEALQAYFARIEQANARFRDDALSAGWLSDRGMVFVSLGEPDALYEQSLAPGRARTAQTPVRVQTWEYRPLQLQLVFTDQDVQGRFRLTQRSESDFRSVLLRQLVD
jgi:GWxTD domain-containing protein